MYDKTPRPRQIPTWVDSHHDAVTVGNRFEMRGGERGGLRDDLSGRSTFQKKIEVSHNLIRPRSTRSSPETSAFSDKDNNVTEITFKDCHRFGFGNGAVVLQVAGGAPAPPCAGAGAPPVRWFTLRLLRGHQ